MEYVVWIGTFEGKKKSEKYLHFDSQIVKQLRNLGVIPFAKVRFSLRRYLVNSHELTHTIKRQHLYRLSE